MARVVVKGAKELAAALSDPALFDRILRPGFEKAAVIIVDDAKGKVHRVTGKLGRSLGARVEGRGRDLTGIAGVQPGRGQPAPYDRSSTSAWKRPRSGTNTGDPREYGFYEEHGTRHRPGHPFLEPALNDNLGRIENVIGEEAERVIAGLRRR